MRFEQLEYFLALEKEGNFTKAAEACFISQSSLSKQIRNLEKELGTDLFVRAQTGTSLTEAGRSFSPHAHALYEECKKAQASLAPFRVKEEVPIRICSVPILAEYGLMDVLQTYRTLHPETPLSIYESSSAETLNSLISKNVDAIFIRYGSAVKIFGNSPEYSIMTIVPDRPALIVSRDHPLAERSVIPLYEARDEVFHLFRPNSQPYETFYCACLEAGFAPKVSSYCVQTNAIARILRNHGGVSILAEHVARYTAYLDSGIRAIPVTEDINVSLCAVFRKGCSDALLSILQFLVEHSDDAAPWFPKNDPSENHDT